jgi:iron complex outermembrane receptor protein
MIAGAAGDRARVVSALVVCLMAALPAAAQPTGRVSGTVIDATGGALAGVTIALRGPVNRDTETGMDGRFAFERLSDGQFDLTARRDGFATLTRAFRLSRGESATFSLTLAVLALEQVTVTASRTGERDLQAVPMAVSVLPASELQRAEARTVEDIAGRAPSVTFAQNTGFSQLTIRGIGTNAVFAGSDPSSAVYVDGVYLARPAMVLTDFVDLERIEVLRGPQGTLYGRNVVGGALNLTTRSPTNELEASARLTAGELGTLRAEARVSGPIVRNRILGSAAILRGVADGFVRDVDHPDHPLGGDDIVSARSKLLVVFSPRSDLLLSGDLTSQDPAPLVYAKVLAVKPGFIVDNPPDLHDVRASTLAEGDNLQYGASARWTFRLSPDMSITSLTAYRKLDYHLIVDADITELDLTISNVHEIQHQVSQELTVLQNRGRLRWIGGVFLFQERDRQPTIVTLNGPRVENHLDPDVEAGTAAGFGEVTFDPVRRVSVTAGLRYTRDRKTIDNGGGLFRLDAPGAVIPASAYAYTDEISHDAWSPRFALDFQAAASTFAYVSAARGFKSGGFNLASNEPGRGFAPEWAWSYEGGLKTDMAGGRARLGVAAFFTDYTDLQVMSTFRPGVIDITNAAAATIKGVELEGSSVLERRLRAGGHVAWLDAEYDRYAAVGPGGITADVAGNRLSNAPEWSGRLWLEWSPEIGRAGVLSLRADARWQSTVYFTPFNDAVQYQPSYGRLDASAEFRPGPGYSVGVYARNLTNEDYITGTFSSPPPAFGGRPGKPREIGIQVTLTR